MFVFKNERKINGNTVINRSTIYRSIDGNIYCEGCMIEPYFDRSSNKVWYQRSKLLFGHPNRVYEITGDTFHRIKDKRKIIDWQHRIFLSKLQKF